ncbi:Putative ribonuclease H protein At1g65750 [Linum perenne]
MRAELRTVEFGLRIAWDTGVRKVQLQLDSAAAVAAILGESDFDSRHGQTLQSIANLRQKDWEVDISHIYREGNRVADLLANHGHLLDFELHVNCLYPSEVDRTIWSDFCGACLPRLCVLNK